MSQLNALYILDVLKKYTDREHPAQDQNQILQWLADDFGVSMDRKALQRNIDALIEKGEPIAWATTDKRKSQNARKGFFYDWDQVGLTDAELRLMMDSILTSRHINSKQADDIIAWLGNQGSVNLRRRYSRVKSQDYGYHAPSQELFLNTELLYDALESKKKVRFNYNEIDLDGKLRVRDRGVIASPYHMVVNNGRYYLIAHADDREDLVHYRVDKISGMEILEENRIPISKVHANFNLDNYLQEHVNMFYGKTQTVTLKVRRDSYKVIFDNFGDHFTPVKKDNEEDDYAVIRIKANLTGLYHLALQYGDAIEVLEPQELRDKIRESVIELSSRYRVTQEDRYQHDIYMVQNAKHHKMLNLTRMDLQKHHDHEAITDLQGIRIGRNNTTDYTFLKNYKELESLGVAEPELVQFIDWAALPIKSLDVGGVMPVRTKHRPQLADLNFLKDCPQLESLDIVSLEVADLSALYELPNLKRLRIREEEFDRLELDKLPPVKKQEKLNFFYSIRFEDKP